MSALSDKLARISQSHAAILICLRPDSASTPLLPTYPGFGKASMSAKDRQTPPPPPAGH